MRIDKDVMNHHKPKIRGIVVDEMEVEEIEIHSLQLPDAQNLSALQSGNFECSAGHIQH